MTLSHANQERRYARGAESQRTVRFAGRDELVVDQPRAIGALLEVDGAQGAVAAAFPSG